MQMQLKGRLQPEAETAPLCHLSNQYHIRSAWNPAWE